MAKGIPAGSECDTGLVCRGNQCIAEPCASSAACDAAAPYCVADLCAEACADDTQCPGFAQAAAQLYCVTGSCVECRAGANDCPAAAPVCDAGACRGCTANSECSSDLCDGDTGQCVDPSTIVYVSPTGSAISGCTQVDPCTLDRAFAILDSTHRNVRLLPGSHMSTTDRIITGTTTKVAFYGPATMNVSISVQNGATLVLRDLTFQSPNGSSLGCRPGTVGGPMPIIDADRVVFGDDNGVSAGGPCTVTLRRVKMRDVSGSANSGAGALIVTGGETAGVGGATLNRGSVFNVSEADIAGGECGILVTGHTSLHLTNSVIHDQTVGAQKALNFTIPNDAPGSVTFSTFYNNSLSCTNGAVATTFENNIWLNVKGTAPTDLVGGTSCTHTYSIIKPQANPPPGNSNNMLNVLPGFVDGPGGNFHLTAGSPAIDAANPTSTEALDFEGTTRPQGAGRDIGAFEYKP